MPLSNRTICAILFHEVTPGHFVCNSCSRTYRSIKGFTNLMNHLRRFHPTYEAEAETALREENALCLHIVDARTSDIFRWVEWIVMERLPFSFCERRLARLNAKMSSISEKTLTRYITLLAEHVDGRITEMLPLKFGIVLDGWTCAGRHFVAIFVVFDDGDRSPSTSHKDEDYFDDLDCPSRRFVLLTFSPVDDEEDLGAQSLFDLISDTLSSISVAELVQPGADRLSGTRRSTADPHPRIDEVAIQFEVPCDASQDYAYDTRWSSVYAIVERYVKLLPSLRKIDHGSVAEYGLDDYLLTRRENDRANTLAEDLEKLDGVTRTLQKPSLTLSGVRRLFSHVLVQYPLLDSCLGQDAAIINNKTLESGIVKLQRHEPINAAERQPCAMFKLPDKGHVTTEAGEEQPSFVSSAFKRRKSSRRQHYMDVGFVPPTSNECERFFSAAKLVHTDLRRSMEPERLQAVMSLSINRDL